MKKTYQKKKKQSKAPWTRAFKQQAAALHPERSAARSGSEAARMAVYNEIAKMFMGVNGMCANCGRYERHERHEVHHKKGRDGLLLFDVRHWLRLCPTCHSWIHANEDEARKLGLLAQRGDWGKQDEQ